MQQNADTTMSRAFAKAGVGANEAKLRVEIARYINNGGTYARLAEIVEELSGGGHMSCAGSGHHVFANAGQTESSGVANPLPHIADGGQLLSALQAKDIVPPVCEPTPAQRAATHAVARRAALTVFERELTRTGQQWGKVNYRDLDAFAEDADIAMAVKAHIGHLRGDDRHKTIKDLMTPREFSLLIARVRKGKQHAA